MGSFVAFRCDYCHYQEQRLGLGRGRRPLPYLRLFRCDQCKSVGSTWIYADQAPRCSYCYNEGIALLPDDAGQIDCPRCGEPARFLPLEGSWE